MTWAEVEANSSQIERALDSTAEIDRWCSGPDWVLSVHRGFAPESECLLLREEHDAPGFALLARYRLHDGSTMLAGLEPLWGFAAPVFGPNMARLGGALAAELAEREWNTLVLPGVPPPSGSSSYAVELARALTPLGEMRLIEGIVRQVAHIGDGSDAWLARRSNRFRRNLRQAERRGAEAGVIIVEAHHDAGAYERIMTIEAASWKGREGSGITAPEMAETYRSMVERLRNRGRLRVGVATIDDVDVGYILGGVRGRTYRGLQLSYVDAARRLSVGNLLQAWQIAALEPEGLHHYDLGMDMDYKRRWADRAEPSLTLVIQRH